MGMMQGEQAKGWPMRPWLMAAIGAIAGLIFWQLVGETGAAEPSPLRQAAATFVMVATLAFLITAERLRLAWAAGFALGWGVVVALVGFYTASYNYRGEIVEFPFLSALLAVGIAAPLFQVVRDEGRLALPYPSLHRYVWSDAIIGAASLAFTGLTFLMSFLLAHLFDAIGISVFRQLLEKGWFAWMLAGAAFGAASATLRERAPLLGTLQRLVSLVAAILAPILAGSLALFLLALPATGFAGLWKSGVPETPMLLAAAAFAFVLLNAIIGDSSDERGKGLLWKLTELGLLAAVLPLGILALVSMGIRVDQYGWTPERLWGVIACLVAIAFGIANWLAWIRGRGQFDERLRDYQKRLAIGVSGLALVLALPVFDFGAISSRSQLARLESGRVEAAEFDWAAMAFEFGPSGRRALSRLAESGPAEWRRMAARALESDDRRNAETVVRTAQAEASLDRSLRLASPDIRLDEVLRRHIATAYGCGAPNRCALIRIDERRLALMNAGAGPSMVSMRIIDLDRVSHSAGKPVPPPTETDPVALVEDLTNATIELREVERKQVYVDGKPVGVAFE
ncbi:MAG TPA: DUF4153 domain-containing protein [Sphingomicrobium sp.]|nr:DUF4153 domain-containing protein [Sphingomicrobium sp.]